MYRSLFLAAPLAISMLACATDEPEQIYENDEPFVVVDFRSALGSESVDVVGVTIRPDTGQRYVLDSARGIYEVDLEGEMTLLLALDKFPVADQPLQSEFTDIAALAGEQFVLTARNEGYLLDLGANTLQRHFCYLPDDQPAQEVYQLTHSVTFDAASHQIYAQPQTLTIESNSVQASSIGMFGESDGAEQTWYALPDRNYIAGAIAMTGEGNLLLARDASITQYNFSTLTQGEELSLDAYDVGEVTGLAIDTEAQTILVVDGIRDALLELPLSLLD